MLDLGGNTTEAEAVLPTRSKRTGLEDLYRLHAPAGRRLAYLLTGDRQMAEDLTQDAFIKVIGRLGHLRNQDAFGPYLQRAIVNQARMQFRRNDVERRYLERQKRELEQPVVDRDLESVEALRSALMTLPYRQRAAIVLRFYIDLSDEQSAEFLDCAVGTVRSLISRGVTELRHFLGGEDLG